MKFNWDLQQRRRSGFALVASISVISLVMMIALAMLSLATVNTKITGSKLYSEQARANARLALAQAIAKLQQDAGPDQRITASADIVDSETKKRGKVAGVWESWSGAYKNLTIPPSRSGSPISYDEAKEERFVSWLVSSPDQNNYDLVVDGDSANTIRLIGTEGGTGDGQAVYASIMQVDANSIDGGYAYAVFDEGTKANISLAPDKSTTDPALNEVALHTNMSNSQRNAPEVLGGMFEEVDIEDDGVRRMVSLETAELLEAGNASSVGELVHALTTHSSGLLVDVNRSGFKQDLSLATESSAIPLALTTGNYARPYRGMSWAQLHRHCRQYKEMLYSGNQVTGETQKLVSSSSVVNRTPVLARLQNIVSYDSKPTNDPNVRKVGLRLTPVVTLWNPYNVRIVVRNYIHFGVAALPFALQLKVGGVTKPWVHFSESVKGGMSYGLRLQKNSTTSMADSDAIILEPGESKVFSPLNSSQSAGSSGKITLVPGYRNQGGFFFSKQLNSDPDVEITANLTDTISFAVRPDTDLDTFQDWSVAYHVNTFNGYGQKVEANRMNGVSSITRHLNELKHTDTADVLVSNTTTYPRPVCASLNLQVQTASDAVTKSLGFAQTNPFVHRSEYGRANSVRSASGSFTREGLIPQPLSLSWIDISCIAHPDWNDTYLPQVDLQDRGFVASGVRADTGVSFAVVNDIPHRPLQSLGDLQHFNYAVGARSNTHEFPHYVIGNSIASPVIYPGETGRVIIERGPGRRDYIHQDFSYMANALMFDRYFFSSIAPRSEVFSASPEDQQTLEDAYRLHISGEQSLPNSRYRPTGKVSEGDVSDLALASETIASKLTVLGAFNVNSTSVNAWKVVLASLNGQRVAYRDVYNSPDLINSEVPDADSPNTYVISRASLPSGGSADTADPDPNQIPEELFWRGYRTLTQEQIGILAEKIVEQVKLRGPFLSVGEFVNRRLSSLPEDKILAARGAIQAALDDPAVTINDTLKDPMVGRSIAKAEVEDYESYVFPEAAEGNTAFAAAGWVTQADLLRPLAPYMTVRSDTFKVRAYGEAKNENGIVVARAWCEAIIQRCVEYMDPSDEATEKAMLDGGAENLEMSDFNKKYGRRFEVVSFKWLTEQEV